MKEVKAEDLRAIAKKSHEMGDIYNEMADLCEKETTTKEEDERMTYLFGRIMEVALEVQMLGGK